MVYKGDKLAHINRSMHRTYLPASLAYITPCHVPLFNCLGLRYYLTIQ